MLLHEPHAVTIRKGPPRPQDAIPPFAASSNSYDMATEDEIGDAFTLLAASGDAISMYAAGSREAILGRMLTVDPEEPHFVMELNEGASLPPGNVTFVTVLGNAKLQFTLSSKNWRCTPGKPHLIPMVFPETCTVMNRRSCERVETALGANFSAAFVMNGSTPYELSIYDLSKGGLGLRGAKSETKGLFKGRKLRDVVLDLGQETIHVAEMEIRVSRSYRSFLLGEQVHLGCKFVNIAPAEDDKLHEVLERMCQHTPRR